MEIDVSLGMRKYLVLITSDRGLYPIFKWELGRYVLSKVGTVAVKGCPTEHRFTHELWREEKGKRKAHTSQTPSTGSGTLVCGSLAGGSKAGGPRSPTDL